MVVHLIFSQHGLEQCLRVRARDDVLIALDSGVASAGIVIRYHIYGAATPQDDRVSSAELLDLLERYSSVSWY